MTARRPSPRPAARSWARWTCEQGLDDFSSCEVWKSLRDATMHTSCYLARHNVIRVRITEILPAAPRRKRARRK